MASQRDGGIPWCAETWNPIRGCSRVSEGCRNCYAERTAVRQIATGYRGLVKSTSVGPRWTGEVRFIEDALALPLRWRTPRRIFVNSMSDLFHERVEERWIDAIFAVMSQSPQHIFQVLTKRPERMRSYFHTDDCEDRVEEVALQHFPEWCHANTDGRWPLPNVHLGVSVEDQATADARIPLLLQTPAAVRWVSYEPALGPVDFTKVCDRRRRRALWMNTIEAKEANPAHAELVASLGPDYPYTRLDWIVVGGESGPGARPFDLAWARSTIAQCRAAGVPVFVKQLGAVPFGFAFAEDDQYPWPPHVRLKWSGDGIASYRVRLRDRKGGDWLEWPSDLRVREFPREFP